MPKIIVTEEQWIESGLKRFARNGSDGLVIESMASELGCSKSSFYWYFDNRSEFIAKIVNQWAYLATVHVMDKANNAEDPETRLTALLTQMFAATQNGDFLFYLRRASRENPQYGALLEQVEQTRMDYARQLLIQAGTDAETAACKSSLLYHYYLGWYERHKHLPVGDEERDRHISMLRSQLLGI
ncbi:TetR/AcrR family transcriptional regulator [Paenibacillus xanthanilyticus]|uniref:TetR/AcrR family transcriptional regulator n=1 Tax=Paenibacillus xanthanilyticus TaxID=1783531 RepID=A0ABV8JXK9_9BACL